MPLFSRKEPSVKNFLVIDIDSASVGGALVQHIEGDRPEIMMSLRLPVAVQEEFDFDHFFSAIQRALDTVCARLFHDQNVPPEEIFVTLHAPWVASQTRMIHRHSKTPFIFTQELATELIQREIQKYHDGDIKDFAEYRHDHNLLEHKTMRVTLNGYLIRNPLGKQTQSAEITSFMSVIPRDVERALEHKIEKHFHANITMHSFAFASHAVIKNHLRNQSDSLIIDVSGEMTEISVVRKDVLMQTASFPFGSSHIIRHIGQQLGISPAEARSRIAMYTAGTLSDIGVYEIEPVVREAEKKWAEYLKKILSDISQTSLIPDVVFLSAEDAFLSFFQQGIEDEDFHQYIYSHRKFSVVPLTLRTLKGQVIDRQQKHDPEILIATLFSVMLTHRTSAPQDLDLL